MQVTRRFVTSAIAATLVSGCMGGGGLPVAAGAPTDPSLRPQPNPAFDAWVRAFRGRAASRGIRASVLDDAFRGAGFLPGVIERDRNQTEFKRSLEDYLAIVAPEEKVSFGRGKYAGARSVLNEVAARYGVPAEISAAIWGVESYFGTKRGTIPVISATATLAFDGRRGDFFEAQLMAALRILQNGDARADQLVGSWAGAMGHTQFIPTTYEGFAVDFRGDGKREIWSDDPTDGLASTANYLAKSGWRRSAPWGMEVILPAGFDSGLLGRGRKRGVGAWRNMGVRPAAGGSLPDHGNAAILAPAGVGGPAFITYRNFDVILRYNASENYGLGVGYLAGRLAGGGPLKGTFGPDRYGLTLAQRKRLQERLTAAGFDAGKADGVLGKKSEAALRAFQAARGMTVTGTPTPEVIAALL
ncbi:MAG: lytic murein transglycosylase [Paracoccaceae bacterium]|nr:lytic murein transglycosylase [Paracoccaceae bacterium]